jgi:hypothetical protein
LEAPSPLPHATCTPNWWRRLLPFSLAGRPRAFALSAWIALIVCGAGLARAGNLLGAYSVAAAVPGGHWSYAHPEVAGSESWYVRAVLVNDVRLSEGIDYSVVDDGSNKGVVIFAAPPTRGDHVEIDGPTLEPGAHAGTILFL